MAEPRISVLIVARDEAHNLAECLAAARWADEWNTWGTPEVLAAKGRVLDGHCEDLGRDTDRVQRLVEVEHPL